MNYNHRARQPSSSNSSSFPQTTASQNDNPERDINSAAPAAAPFSIDRTHPPYAHSSQQSRSQGVGHQQLGVEAGGSYGHFNGPHENVYAPAFGLSTAYPYQSFTEYGTHQQYQPPTRSYPSPIGYPTAPLQPPTQVQASWSHEQGYATLPESQLQIPTSRSVRYSPSSIELGAPPYSGESSTAGQALQRHASAGNLFPTHQAPREHSATSQQLPHSRSPHTANQSSEPTTSRQVPRQRVRVPQKKFSAHYHITTPNPLVQFMDPSTGAAGVFVKAALEEGSPRVKGHRDVVFAEDLPATITLRIVWPGYDIYSRRIGTKTSGTNPRPLNRGEVANAIYETLKLFFMDKKASPNATAEERAWKIGRNNAITLSQVILVNLEQVTQGSWQPELMIERGA